MDTAVVQGLWTWHGCYTLLVKFNIGAATTMLIEVHGMAIQTKLSSLRHHSHAVVRMR